MQGLSLRAMPWTGRHILKTRRRTASVLARWPESLLVGGAGYVFRVSHYREQHHELIPTLAADSVRAARASHQALCDRLEKLIANRVTQGIFMRLKSSKTRNRSASDSP